MFTICRIFYNLFFITEKRRHEEGSEQRQHAEKIFGVSHGVSNLINLGGVACNVAFFYLLAHKIVGHW
jgi:hypothetical protein